MEANSKYTQPVLLFDGVCNLCNASIQFILNRDKKKELQFTSLQSEAGQEILTQYQLPTTDFDTIILLSNNQIYTKSSAALKVAKQLNGAWPLLSVFQIVPKPIRDFVYSLIANNRYKWFGKTEECWIPTPEIKMRFLS